MPDIGTEAIRGIVHFNGVDKADSFGGAGTVLASPARTGSPARPV
ncbi:hypothetical protein [Dactylosporangium sp. NPDC005555]